jgi:hypothetical protein
METHRYESMDDVRNNQGWRQDYLREKLAEITTEENLQLKIMNEIFLGVCRQCWGKVPCSCCWEI